jgi:hypothetical protein
VGQWGQLLTVPVQICLQLRKVLMTSVFQPGAITQRQAALQTLLSSPVHVAGIHVCD